MLKLFVSGCIKLILLTQAKIVKFPTQNLGTMGSGASVEVIVLVDLDLNLHLVLVFCALLR